MHEANTEESVTRRDAEAREHHLSTCLQLFLKAWAFHLWEPITFPFTFRPRGNFLSLATKGILTDIIQGGRVQRNKDRDLNYYLPWPQRGTKGLPISGSCHLFLPGGCG